MSTVAVDSAALPDSKVETKHESSKDHYDDEPNNSLAFLPNLVPTYMTEVGDGVRVGMFSLFHDRPDAQQRWRILLRGSDLPQLLVDGQTIEFLEKCGGVEWKPLPPNNNQGSAGIVFEFARFDDTDGALTAMCAALSLTNQPACGAGGENDDSKESEPITSASEVSTDIEPFDESDSSETGPDGPDGPDGPNGPDGPDGGPENVLASSDANREVQGGAKGAAR